MSGSADAGRPQASLRPWEEAALEALRWDWAYLIGHDDERGWWAARRDRIGALMTTDGPDELRREISEDYALKPVPREPHRRTRVQTARRVLGADPGELLTESAEP